MFPRTPLAQAFEYALAMGEIGNMVAALVVLDQRQGGVGVEDLPGQHHVEQLASLGDGQRGGGWFEPLSRTGFKTSLLRTVMRRRP